jgi:hypothetical protein
MHFGFFPLEGGVSLRAPEKKSQRVSGVSQSRVRALGLSLGLRPTEPENSVTMDPEPVPVPSIRGGRKFRISLYFHALG